MKPFVPYLVVVNIDYVSSSHLQVHPQEWVKMTPDQRKQLLKRFDDASLRKCKFTEKLCASSDSGLPTTRSITSSILTGHLKKRILIQMIPVLHFL